MAMPPCLPPGLASSHWQTELLLLLKLSSSVCAGYTFGASGYWKAPWHQLPVAVAHVTSLSGALSCATGSAPTRPGPSHALLGVRGQQRAARVLLAHGPAVALEHPLRGAEAALASRAREAARGVVLAPERLEVLAEDRLAARRAAVGGREEARLADGLIVAGEDACQWGEEEEEEEEERSGVTEALAGDAPAAPAVHARSDALSWRAQAAHVRHAACQLRLRTVSCSPGATSRPQRPHGAPLSARKCSGQYGRPSSYSMGVAGWCKSVPMPGFALRHARRGICPARRGLSCSPLCRSAGTKGASAPQARRAHPPR